MLEDEEKRDDLRTDVKEFSQFILLTVIIGGIVLGVIVAVGVFATQPTRNCCYQIVPYL